MGGLENDLSNNWNCEICLGSVGFHKVSTYLLLVKTIYWRRKPSLFHGLVVEMPMIQESKLGAKNFTQRMRKNESTKLDPVKPPLHFLDLLGIDARDGRLYLWHADAWRFGTPSGAHRGGVLG